MSTRPIRVVLLMKGTFNPPNYMHLRMFELARDFLVSTGKYRVLGGILSPSPMQLPYPFDKEMLEHVLSMLKLTLKNSTWLRLDTWSLENETADLLSLLHYHSDLIDSTLNQNQIDPYTPTKKRRDSAISNTINHQNTFSCLTSESMQAASRQSISHPVWQQQNFTPTTSQSFHFSTFHQSSRICENNEKSSSPKAEGCIEVMLLCGSDVMKSWSPWQLNQVEQVVGEYNVVVVSRTEHDVQKYIYESDVLTKFKNNIHVVSDWIPNDIQSSRLRTAVRRKQSVRYLLPDDLIRYIYKNDLYSNNQLQRQQQKLNQQSFLPEQHEVLRQTGDQVSIEKRTPSDQHLMQASLSSAPTFQGDLSELLDFNYTQFDFESEKDKLKKQKVKQSQQRKTTKPQFGYWSNKYNEASFPRIQRSYQTQQIKPPILPQHQPRQKHSQRQQLQRQDSQHLQTGYRPEYYRQPGQPYFYEQQQKTPQYYHPQPQQRRIRPRGASAPRTSDHHVVNLPYPDEDFDSKLPFGRSKSLDIDYRRGSNIHTAYVLSGQHSSKKHTPPNVIPQQLLKSKAYEDELKKKCKKENSMDSLLTRITKSVLGDSKLSKKKQLHFEPPHLLAQQQMLQQHPTHQFHEVQQPKQYFQQCIKPDNKIWAGPVINVQESKNFKQNRKNFSLDFELDKRKQHYNQKQSLLHQSSQAQRPMYFQSSEKLKVDPNKTPKNIKSVRLTPETCV